MDTANRRPQLPALAYLDIDKVKREEELYQNRNTGAAQTHHSAPAASPTYQYPPHPPPPYSHPTPQHANSWPGPTNPPVNTPPDSRRTSGDEIDNIKKTTRQSLPSISEALGETSYPSSTSAPQQAVPSTHLPQPAAPPSPISSSRRPYPMEPPQPQNPYANNAGYQYSSFRQDSAGPQSFPPPDSSKPAYAPTQDSRPPLHLHTSTAPPRTQPPASYSYQQTTSPQYEQQSSQSAGSMGPLSFPYGYTPYPPRYAQPPSSSSQSSGPIYQPSAQYATPSTPSSSWKAESAPARFGPDDRSSTAPYGDSVKRHLDLYDLEAALNEIANTSGHMQDFSRRYGDRMHQHTRSGPPLNSLPSMVEVEDMLAKSKIQMDSLAKIRDVIIAQQAVYQQQMDDQRQQQKAYPESAPPIEQQMDGIETKGGFAGPDTKKRRGRAAPPGRCHSCNRAETPEWRRGPDGARTLCNACGLHYAKLTRKQTGGNKSANVGSSNLRPKEA